MRKRDYDGPGKLFENGGGFYYYTGKAFDIIAVSILWLLGSLPIITIGASFSALYASASKAIRQDVGTVKGEFWKAYKRDLKCSFLPLLIYAGALFLLLLNMGIIWKLGDGLFRLFFFMFYGACVIFLLAALSYAFPAVSRFDMPAAWILKLSLYLTVRYLPTSVLLVLIFAAGYFLVLTMPVLAVIVPGTAACLISGLVDPILDKHMQEEKA